VSGAEWRSAQCGTELTGRRAPAVGSSRGHRVPLESRDGPVGGVPEERDAIHLATRSPGPAPCWTPCADCNGVRPHSALANRTEEFRTQHIAVAASATSGQKGLYS
jgi:hypothetical protein